MICQLSHNPVPNESDQRWWCLLRLPSTFCSPTSMWEHSVKGMWVRLRDGSFCSSQKDVQPKPLQGTQNSPHHPHSAESTQLVVRARAAESCMSFSYFIRIGQNCQLKVTRMMKPARCILWGDGEHCFVKKSKNCCFLILRFCCYSE